MYCEILLEILKDYGGRFYLRAVYTEHPAIYQLPAGFLPLALVLAAALLRVSPQVGLVCFSKSGAAVPRLFSFSRTQGELLGLVCAAFLLVVRME